jgi:cell division protease FtsH
MFTKPYSDETARVIDEEVSKLIESQYQRAIQTLTENKDKLTALANKLLTSEVIFKEDLEEIFGKRPWDVSEIPHPSEPEASEEISESSDLTNIDTQEENNAEVSEQKTSENKEAENTSEETKEDEV